MPGNFKLKGKPLYLRKYKPRKGGKLPKDKPMVKYALTIEEKFRLMDCTVRLENCDDMIGRVLTNQREKDKKQNKRQQQYEDEGIEIDKSDGKKHGSDKDEDEQNASVEVEHRNDEIGMEKGAVDDNELDEGANDLHHSDSNEKFEDETNQRKSKRENFVRKEYERRMHRAIDHMNSFDLVIKLKPYNEDEVNQTCLDILTGEGEDDANIDQSSIGADESPIINTVSASDMEQNTIKSPAYETLGRKSSDNAASNDDEEITCRKDPSPRTYERRGRRMTISCEENMNAERVNEPTSNTERATIAQKSNGSIHENNFVDPKEASVDKNKETPVESDASVVSGDDTPINNDSTHDQNNMHSVMVPYLFEDLDDGRDYSDVSDPFVGVVDPFSNVEFENEPNVRPDSELTPHTSMETEENAEETPEEMPEEQSEPEPATEFSANVQNSPRNTSMIDGSEVVANTVENDEQAGESNESMVTAADANDVKVRKKQPDAPKDQTNDLSNQEPEHSEASTIAIGATGAAQSVEDISQVHADNITNNENLIQLQRAELLEKDKQIDEKNKQINDLLAQLSEKNKIETQLNVKMQTMQQEHDAQLRKAIDDTKNKNWCTMCKEKIAIKNFHPYVCGRKCLHQLWYAQP